MCSARGSGQKPSVRCIQLHVQVLDFTTIFLARRSVCQAVCMHQAQCKRCSFGQKFYGRSTAFSFCALYYYRYYITIRGWAAGTLPLMDEC